MRKLQNLTDALKAKFPQPNVLAHITSGSMSHELSEQGGGLVVGHHRYIAEIELEGYRGDFDLLLTWLAVWQLDAASQEDEFEGYEVAWPGDDSHDITLTFLLHEQVEYVEDAGYTGPGKLSFNGRIWKPAEIVAPQVVGNTISMAVESNP